MIPVPTAPWMHAPWMHAPFDLLAWASDALLGRALYRWRLRAAALDLARATGSGSFVCFAVGAVAAAVGVGVAWRGLALLRRPPATADAADRDG